MLKRQLLLDPFKFFHRFKLGLRVDTVFHVKIVPDQVQKQISEHASKWSKLEVELLVDKVFGRLLLGNLVFFDVLVPERYLYAHLVSYSTASRRGHLLIARRVHIDSLIDEIMRLLVDLAHSHKVLNDFDSHIAATSTDSYLVEVLQVRGVEMLIVYFENRSKHHDFIEVMRVEWRLLMSFY